MTKTKTIRRGKYVFNYRSMLGIENAKTTKGSKEGYLTGIMYLAPSTTCKDAGYKVKNTCNSETAECKELCLNKAGRGRFDKIQLARIDKTRFLLENTNILTPNIDGVRSIIEDIRRLIVKANNKGLTPCVRLNGTSDLPVEEYEIMQLYPSIQFYDYTKHYYRALSFINGDLPPNYDLTFSYSGYNWGNCVKLLNTGKINVAAVFGNGIPKRYKGYKVINGDNTDLTFTYEKGVIVGLTPKDVKKHNKFIITDYWDLT